MRQNGAWQQMTQDATWHHILIFKQKLLKCLKSFLCLSIQDLKYRPIALIGVVVGDRHDPLRFI